MSNGNKPFLSMPPLSKVQTGMQSQNPYDLASMFGLGGGTTSIEARRLTQLDREIANLQNLRRQSGPNLSSLIDLQFAESRRDNIEDKIRSSFVDKARKEAGKLAYKEAKQNKKDIKAMETQYVVDIFGERVAHDPRVQAMIDTDAEMLSRSPLYRNAPYRFASEMKEHLDSSIFELFPNIHRKDLDEFAKVAMDYTKATLLNKFKPKTYEEKELPLIVNNVKTFFTAFENFIIEDLKSKGTTDVQKIKSLVSQDNMISYLNDPRTVANFVNSVVQDEVKNVGWKNLKDNIPLLKHGKKAVEIITGLMKPVSGDSPEGRKSKLDLTTETLQNALEDHTKDWGDFINSPEYKKRIMLDFLRRGQGAYAPNSIVELLDKVKKKNQPLTDVITKLGQKQKLFANSEELYNNFITLGTGLDRVAKMYAQLKYGTGVDQEEHFTKTYQLIRKKVNDDYDSVTKTIDDNLGLDKIQIQQHPWTGQPIHNVDAKKISESLKKEKEVRLKELDKVYEEIKSGVRREGTSDRIDFTIPSGGKYIPEGFFAPDQRTTKPAIRLKPQESDLSKYWSYINSSDLIEQSNNPTLLGQKFYTLMVDHMENETGGSPLNIFFNLNKYNKEDIQEQLKNENKDSLSGLESKLSSDLGKYREYIDQKTLTTWWIANSDRVRSEKEEKEIADFLNKKFKTDSFNKDNYIEFFNDLTKKVKGYENHFRGITKTNITDNLMESANQAWNTISPHLSNFWKYVTKPEVQYKKSSSTPFSLIK